MYFSADTGSLPVHLSTLSNPVELNKEEYCIPLAAGSVNAPILYPRVHNPTCVAQKIGNNTSLAPYTFAS